METEQGARQVLTAIQATGASTADRERLTTIILTIASTAAQQILEDLMTTIEWKSDFIEGFHQQGREEGREEGRQEGREQGLQESKAEYLLKIIDSRRIAVTEQDRQQVTSCTDLTQLDQWFDRALTASTAADIFKD
jgi:predicted transposase YdaD